MDSHGQYRLFLLLRPKLTKLQLAYDLFMIFMFIMNVLEQPYRHSSEIFARFKRNGIVVYSVSFMCILRENV